MSGTRSKGYVPFAEEVGIIRKGGLSWLGLFWGGGFLTSLVVILGSAKTPPPLGWLLLTVEVLLYGEAGGRKPKAKKKNIVYKNLILNCLFS